MLAFFVILLLANSGFAQPTSTNEESLVSAEKFVDTLYMQKDFTSPNCLPIALEIIDLVSQVKGYDTRKIEVNFALINFFYYAQLYQEVIKKGIETQKIYYQSKEKVTPEEAKLQKLDISYIYNLMADVYEKLNQLDSATFYHKKRISLNESDKNIEYTTSLNNYGLFLDSKKKDKKTALGYFQKAYQITKEVSPNHYLLASIRDNIADVYREQGNIKEANEHYEENVRYFSNSKNNKGEFEDVPRLVSAGRQYMETYFQLNETAKGILAFKKIETLINGVPLPPEAKLEFLIAKQTYLEQINNLAAANSVGKQVLTLSDSIKDDKMEKARKTLEVMSSLTLNKVQLKNQLNRAEKENIIKSQQIIIGIVVLIAFIVGGTLFYLYKLKQQRNINLQNEQLLSQQLIEITVLKNKQLESEIEAKKRDLTDFALNLSQSMEWAEVLKQKIDEKKQGLTKEAKQLLVELEEEINTKIKFDANNQEFLERLDALSDSFYSQLKIRYPNLTKTELRLCSLIRLKLEPQQIANLQNISLPSIHTARYRLRKKMMLPESVNLDQIIQEL